jgi:SAM-dependent methyltransferase
MAELDNEGDTDLDWKKIAEAEPFWGVLSLDQYKGRQLGDEQAASFFRSGDLLVESIVKDIRQTFDGNFTPTRSLDFGCGVGRLLLPIARLTLGEAVGIDVAPNMLAIADRYVKQSGLTNVTLVLGDDDLSQLTGNFDFINSYIVLQHIPPARGYAIVQKLLSMLRPKGIGSLQFTFAKDRKFFQHEAWTARFYRRDGGTIHDLLPKPLRYPQGTIRMFDYDLNNFHALLATNGIRKSVTNMTNDDGHLGVHMIFRREQ